MEDHLHGVMNVLVWTTFFISGFLMFATVHALETPLQSMVLGWAAFGGMSAGLAVTAIPLLGNQATVLFTFYRPLKAHAAFYLGLTLVVAATCLVTLSLIRTYRVWRLKNPGE
jgi:cytochrome c oxidase subunit I